MHYGVSMAITDYSMAPGPLARAVEERGFESLFVPEHSHIPSSRRSPWGGGDTLPKVYHEMMDPFVVLGAAAAVTTRLELGTGVCLVVQRDPIQLAKEVATLDRISSGRVLLGVGGGWNAEEMADHGTAFQTRFEVLEERIAAMKAIWTRDEPSFEGKHVSFGPMRAWPKPVQTPHPPILVGGAFPHAARRAVAYGNGWIPIAGRGHDVVEELPAFRAMASEAGRDPDALPVTSFLAPHDPDALARMRDAGIARAVFLLVAKGEAETLPRLDMLAEVAARVG
jgi:probable F420-dependent oxidoreductase